MNTAQPEPGSDLERLDQNTRLLLSVKIDGQIEDAMFTCLQQGFSAQEAMRLVTHAFLREILARGLDRDAAHRLLTRAMSVTCPETPPAADTVPRVVN
jgi:hypothetical protein